MLSLTPQRDSWGTQVGQAQQEPFSGRARRIFSETGVAVVWVGVVRSLVGIQEPVVGLSKPPLQRQVGLPPWEHAGAVILLYGLIV